MKDRVIEEQFVSTIMNLAVIKERSEEEYNELIDWFTDALFEWYKTHIVFTSPRMIELYGEVLDIENPPKHDALPPQPVLKESPIYHICCCKKISTHPILTTVHRCECGAVWSGTNGSTLQVFGSTSCYDCYAHETKGLRNPKSYILDHCRHARRKMRKY